MQYVFDYLCYNFWFTIYRLQSTNVVNPGNAIMTFLLVFEFVSEVK